MDFKLVVWFYLPILIGLLIISGTLYLTANRRNIIGFITSFLILVLNVFSIYVLVEIIAGSYPTYIPHIFIAISAILLIIQKFWLKKNKVFVNRK